LWSYEWLLRFVTVVFRGILWWYDSRSLTANKYFELKMENQNTISSQNRKQAVFCARLFSCSAKSEALGWSLHSGSYLDRSLPNWETEFCVRRGTFNIQIWDILLWEMWAQDLWFRHIQGYWWARRQIAVANYQGQLKG